MTPEQGQLIALIEGLPSPAQQLAALIHFEAERYQAAVLVCAAPPAIYAPYDRALILYWLLSLKD